MAGLVEGSGSRAIVACNGRHGPELLVASGRSVERWQEKRHGQWTRIHSAFNPAQSGPIFSLALNASGSGEVAAGGGTDRAVSIFSGSGSVTGTLPGHTGWVRAVAFHGPHLFSVGCQFVKVWRRAPEGWAHVGDLRVHGDILGLTVAAGSVLLAAGVAAQVYQWTLPPEDLRPHDWLSQARQSFRQAASRDPGRVSSIASHGRSLFTASLDGVLRRWSLSRGGVSLQSSSALPFRVHCMAAHPDGRVACGGSGGSLCVAQHPGSPVETVCVRSGLHQGAPVSSLAWVDDDRIATVSCANQALEVTRVQS